MAQESENVAASSSANPDTRKDRWDKWQIFGLKQTLTIALLVLLSSSLGAAGWKAAMKAQPVDFEVPASEIEAAWARAQEWLASNAPTPLNVATDVVIQTAPSRPANANGYTVTKIKSESGFRIFIKVTTGQGAWLDRIASAGDAPSRILARYMQSGEERCRSYAFTVKSASRGRSCFEVAKAPKKAGTTN